MVQTSESLETRLGYKFQQAALLTQALTHPSLSYETRRRDPDNQRLEFLGDSVLGLVVADEIYRRLPESDEGVLTRLRSRLVSSRTLAKVARQMNLGPELRIGRAEDTNGGRDRESALADALEALIGAIYLDGSLDDARAFVLRILEEELRIGMAEGPESHNPKGELQEMLQALGATAPLYDILNSEGPDHQKRYEAAATWQGHELGRGSGASKKEAEIEAARSALDSPALKKLLGDFSRRKTP